MNCMQSEINDNVQGMYLYYLVKYQFCLRCKRDATNVTDVSAFMMILDVTEKLTGQNVLLAVATTSKLGKPWTQMLGLKNWSDYSNIEKICEMD